MSDVFVLFMCMNRGLFDLVDLISLEVASGSTEKGSFPERSLSSLQRERGKKEEDGLRKF